MSTPATTVRDLLTDLGVPAEKMSDYLGDTYFLEAVEHLDRKGVDPARFARRTSLLLIKPDAIVARAVEPTLEWLTGAGWRLVHSASVPADRHLARALWRTSWATASPERRRLADLLVDICDALVLVVIDDAPAPGEPATVRLTREKGPTDPSRRREGQLRHLLGRYSYLLNLVHTPDEPADVLREFAILFDESGRDRCLASMAAPSRAVHPEKEAHDIARTAYDAVPAYSFDRGDALARIVDDLTRAGVDVDRPDTLDDADCAALLRDSWTRGRALDPWSVIVLGSYVLPMTVDPDLRRTS